MNYIAKTAILPLVLLLGSLVMAPFAWKNVTENRQIRIREEDRAWEANFVENYELEQGSFGAAVPYSELSFEAAEAPEIELVSGLAGYIEQGDVNAPDIKIDADSGIDPNNFITINWPYDEPQIEYVFDANSDPMMMGMIFSTWLKSDAEYSSNISLCVPKKDKAIYDAIYYSKLINPTERTGKCKNNK